MKKKIRTDLLRQLAEHLLKGKLGHKHFDFAIYNDGNENKCGTNGCAAGECPIVWPDVFSFSGHDIMAGEYQNGEALQHFFNILPSMFWHLFVPCDQNICKYGGVELTSYATKEQVASNILIFCDKADNGDFE